MAVRGTFDLNERPATDALRRIEREGARVDAMMHQVGASVDDTFNARNVEEASVYEKALSSVERQGRETFGSLSRNARESEYNVVGSVRRMDSSVILFRENLDRLGRTKATPKINLQGVTKGLTQLELIEERLSKLDRQTASPNVNVRGALPAAARAALPAAARAALPSGGGGGGGGGFSGGSMGIPGVGAVPFAAVGAGLAAAPPLIGGAGALLGSAGAAALGVGALGITAGGVGATAGALAIPTSYIAIKGIKEASKALAAYQKQVIQTGPKSKASAQALAYYNAILGAAPAGVGRFLHARTQLKTEYRAATVPGQSAVTGIGTRALNLGRQLTPTIAPLSNTFLQEAQGQTNQFANFLNDPQSRAFYKTMSHEATADLSNIKDISSSVLRTMENIARAGRPFFHEGVEFLDHWTAGWKTSTNDLQGTRQQIGGFVDQLKSWGKLGGAGFELISDLLSPAARPGQSMVDDLTRQLQQWDKWVNNNPAQVRGFFNEAVKGTEKIAGGIGSITKVLWKTGQLLQPILEDATQLIGVLDSAGLLSSGSLPLLLAAGAGVRNAKVGMQARILGGAPTTSMAPMFLGGVGGGRAPAAAAAAARLPKMTPTPYGPIALPLQERGIVGGRIGNAVGRAGTFLRGFGSSFVPYAALSAGLGAVSQPGGIEEKVQAGLASLTMETLYSKPETAAQQRDKGSQRAAAITRKILRETGSSPAGLRHARQRIHAALGRTGALPGQNFVSGNSLGGEIAGVTPMGIGSSLTGISLPFGIGEEGTVSDSTRAAQIAKLEAAAHEIAQRQRSGNRGRGATRLEDIQGAFGVEERHGVKGAGRTAIASIQSHLQGTHSLGFAESLGQEGLNFAKQLQASNPKLKGAVDELTEIVVSRMRAMGREVAVIHGNIVDVSSKSWAKVADAASNETQRALASTTKNLTAMEHQAMDILRSMGFSGADAHALAKSTFGEHGKASETAAKTITEHGSAIPFSPGYIEKGTGKKGRHATGGRLGGSGLHDTVNLGGGNMAAPGELLIANRHTERRIDRMLAMAGTGTTIAREIGREGRAHSEPFRSASATGSILPAGRLAQSMGLSVSGGPGFGGIPTSGHVGDSLHYSGLAYDASGSAAQMWAYRKRSERVFRPSINELFYDPYPYYIDRGKKVPGSLGGHSDHVHIGFFPGGAKGNVGGGLGRLAGMAGKHSQVHLKGGHSGVGGLTGLIADHANQMVANAGSKKLNQLLGQRGGGGGLGALPGGGGGSPRQNMALARAMLGSFGWGVDQFSPLKSLWTQESGWSTTARNPSSGAYGIPQSLPASKMGPEAQGAGPAAARAQIKWGLGYIKERYGSPAGAWAHEQASNWYSLGGRTPRQQGRQAGFAGWFARGGHFRVKNPTIFGAGEHGEEDVQITPRGRGGRGGGGGPIHVPVSIGQVVVGNAGDAKHVGRNIGKGIAEELTKALRNSDSVGSAVG